MYYKLNKNHQIIKLQHSFKKQELEEIFDIKNRRVALTHIGEIRISTVFLVIDHGFSKGKPILFETAIDEPPNGCEVMERYQTWDQAMIGHFKYVKEVVDIKNESLQLLNQEPELDFNELKKKTQNGFFSKEELNWPNKPNEL